MADARGQKLYESSGVAEVGIILATALMRLNARKSSTNSPLSGDSLLDISPDQSGHERDSESDDSAHG